MKILCFFSITNQELQKYSADVVVRACDPTYETDSLKRSRIQVVVRVIFDFLHSVELLHASAVQLFFLFFSFLLVSFVLLFCLLRCFGELAYHVPRNYRLSTAIRHQIVL